MLIVDYILYTIVFIELLIFDVNLYLYFIEGTLKINKLITNNYLI